MVLQHVLISRSQKRGSSKIVYPTVGEAVFDFTVSPVASIIEVSSWIRMRGKQKSGAAGYPW